MAIRVSIFDPALGTTAKVNGERELPVVIHPHPPIDEEVTALPFSQYFTDNGTATGSSDMIINGATTPTQFYITASPDIDIYVKNIAVRIGDPGLRLDRFGALTALTTGVKFFYESGDTGEIVIEEAIKSNLDFFREASEGKNFGNTSNAFIVDISGGGEDTIFPEIDFNKRFGLLYGLRLRKGTLDRISFLVQDNLAGLSTFNIKGTGLRI